MAIVNKTVVLPVDYTTEIIRGLVGRSKALELGRRLRDLRTKETYLNVMSELPIAGWVSKSQTTPNSEGAEINHKPISQLAWEGIKLVAEEIAVIVPVAEATLEDVEDYGIDLAGDLSEHVIAAFQEVIDGTVFFGVNNPFSDFNGIIPDATSAGAVVEWDGEPGTSFYYAISDAMKYVEESGYYPTIILGGPSLNSAFRTAITELGVNVTEQGEIGRLARHIDVTGAWENGGAFALVGDFRYLVYAFRKEMTMKLLSEATLNDPNTKAVLYNLAQQDMVGFRFKMRLGFALPNPVNRVNSTDKRYPFAIIKNAKYDGSGSI